MTSAIVAMVSNIPHIKPVIAKPFDRFFRPIAPKIRANTPNGGNANPKTPNIKEAIPHPAVLDVLGLEGIDSSSINRVLWLVSKTGKAA